MKKVNVSDIELTTNFRNRDCCRIKKALVFLSYDGDEKVLDISMTVPESLWKMAGNKK